MRKRQDEKAFLFDKDRRQILGKADRRDWDFAIAVTGGDVAAAVARALDDFLREAS